MIILKQARAAITASGGYTSHQSASSILIAESLSSREKSVLQLIGRGLSNKEIGRELSIAPETVKSHVKHIFVKLGVERRMRALTRAQALGLLAPEGAAPELSGAQGSPVS